MEPLDHFIKSDHNSRNKAFFFGLQLPETTVKISRFRGNQVLIGPFFFNLTNCHRKRLVYGLSQYSRIMGSDQTSEIVQMEPEFLIHLHISQYFFPKQASTSLPSTLMKISRELDPSLGPKTLRATGGDISSMQYAEVACAQLAKVKRRSIKAKLGLKLSAQILLEIIRAAQNSKFRRAACNYVADQAFHLLNAIDGGVQGRAIDVNNILQDYIRKLNQDFLSIYNILKGFTSWWSFSRFCAASGEIQRCHDLVEYGMAMYLLLLRCSIARGEERNALRWQYTVAQYLGRKPSLDYPIRDIRHQRQSLQKSSARLHPTVRQTSSLKRMTPRYRQQVQRR